jgi:hypothetical protein
MSELLAVPGEGLPLAEGGEARLRHQPFTIQGQIRIKGRASKIINVHHIGTYKEQEHGFQNYSMYTD